MTDQTIGLPGIPAKRGRLRALAARLGDPASCGRRPPGLSSPCWRRVIGRHFWRDEGEFANILFAAAVTAALVAIVMLIARRALFATVAGRVAGRCHRVGCVGQARDHEHGGARLRPLLLSELLVDRQLPVERPAPLCRGLDCRAACDRRWWAGSPIASTARACRAAGPCCCLPCSYRWPGTAPTARASGATCSSTTRTCMCPRSMRRGARPWRRCGAAPCSRPRRAPRRDVRLHHSIAMRRRGQAAAHHPDPSGIGGAAVAVSGAALRPVGRSVLPVRRSQPAQAAGGDLWRGVVADGVLAAGGRFDPLVRRHAPVRADLHPEQAEGHAAAGAGPLRLSQRRVLSAAARTSSPTTASTIRSV